jgi:hypothetical protein
MDPLGTSRGSLEIKGASFGNHCYRRIRIYQQATTKERQCIV